jgi:hypothetical protein
MMVKSSVRELTWILTLSYVHQNATHVPPGAVMHSFIANALEVKSLAEVD